MCRRHTSPLLIPQLIPNITTRGKPTLATVYTNTAARLIKASFLYDTI